jgi:hypothetical protein
MLRRAARGRDAAPWSRSRSRTGPRWSDALAPRCTPAHAHAHPGTRPRLRSCSLTSFLAAAFQGARVAPALPWPGKPRTRSPRGGAPIPWPPRTPLPDRTTHARTLVSRPRTPCSPPPMAPSRAPPCTTATPRRDPNPAFRLEKPDARAHPRARRPPLHRRALRESGFQHRHRTAAAPTPTTAARDAPSPF